MNVPTLLLESTPAAMMPATMSDPTPSQQRPNADQTADLTPVTVAEAAAVLGISTEAVRMRLKRRTLPGAKGEDGTWRVYLPTSQQPANADPTVSQRSTARDQTADPTPDRTDELITQLRDEVSYLRDQLGQRSRELAEERQRFDVIHREALGRIEALTAGPVADAGETRQDAAQSTQEAPGDEHAGDVAPDTSAPWWRRWWRSLMTGS